MTDPTPRDEPPPDQAADADPSAERRERLERIRRQIEAGAYDTEERMDEALRRMLGRLDEELD